jgi:hypothetical protein
MSPWFVKVELVVVTVELKSKFRFLYEQIQKLVDGDEISSIFIRQNNSAKFRLRSNLSFHVYLSDIPSGGCSRMSKSSSTFDDLPVSEHKAFDINYTDDYALSIKSTKGSIGILTFILHILYWIKLRP